MASKKKEKRTRNRKKLYPCSAVVRLTQEQYDRLRERSLFGPTIGDLIRRAIDQVYLAKSEPVIEPQGGKADG